MPICPLCQQEKPFLLVHINHRTYWRCRECCLIFLSPEQRLPVDRERERYLQHNNHPDDRKYRQFLNRLLNPLLPHLPQGARGLDFGAGPGPTLSVMLEERGYHMNIYDPFFAPDTSVLEDTYDFITCTETVEHFFNPSCEFGRLDSMLKPEGWLGIMTEMFTSEHKFKDWWYHRDPTHVCFYQQETMLWIAGVFGWKAVFPRRCVTLFQKVQAAPVR